MALASMLVATSAWAFGVKDVITMHQAGVADSLITQKIMYSRTTFHLDGADIRALKQAGVTDAVISEMLRTEGVAAPDATSDVVWGPDVCLPYYGPYSLGYYSTYWGWGPVVPELWVGFDAGRFHGRPGFIGRREVGGHVGFAGHFRR